MMITFLLCIAFAFLIIASITDIKSREVPDWLNYALIAFALCGRLIYSIIADDFLILVYGIIGFAVFFAFAVFMYYTGQWGGGDSKLLMGLGALFGVNWHEFSFSGFPVELNMPFSIMFIINSIIAGAVFGIIWSIIIAITNFKKFQMEYARLGSQYKKIKLLVLAFAALVLCTVFFAKTRISAFTTIALISLALILICSLYLFIFIKSVERSCMFKKVPPEKLTEGDWIARDIIVGGKRFAGPKDLGVSIKQIRRLVLLARQKKISFVVIKEGIPFVPSFLIGFLVTLFFGNIIGFILL